MMNIIPSNEKSKDAMDKSWISVLFKRSRSSQSPRSLAIVWVVFPDNRPDHL